MQTESLRKKGKIINSTAYGELNCLGFINIYNHNMLFAKEFKVKADNKSERSDCN